MNIDGFDPTINDFFINCWGASISQEHTSLTATQHSISHIKGINKEQTQHFPLKNFYCLQFFTGVWGGKTCVFTRSWSSPHMSWPGCRQRDIQACIQMLPRKQPQLPSMCHLPGRPWVPRCHPANIGAKIKDDKC